MADAACSMIEYRFCPQCGEELSGKDFGGEGFHPWCEACQKTYVQPVPIQIMALIQSRNGEFFLTENGHFPLFSLRYYEWLEDAFQRGYIRLFPDPPLYSEYLTSFWDDNEKALVIGMRTRTLSADIPPGTGQWCAPDNPPATLTETERLLLRTESAPPAAGQSS